MFYETLMEKKAAKQRFQKLRGLLKRKKGAVSDEKRSELVKQIKEGIESGTAEVKSFDEMFGS